MYVFRSSTTHVDQLLDVSGRQIEEDRGLVQVSQVGHVFAHVELGRVDLANLLLLKHLGLENRAAWRRKKNEDDLQEKAWHTNKTDLSLDTVH